MRNNVLILTTLTLILLMMTSSVLAEVPQYINYQGRLTNDVGEPITNTSPGVMMTFTIWNDETLSDPANEEWSTGVNFYVPVENGLFDVQLGPLPAGLFRDNSDLWLGIQVVGDPEISPRTKLVASGYACHAGTVDDIYVDEIGDVMTGDLIFDRLGNGEIDGEIGVMDSYADIRLYYEQTQLVHLGSGMFGQLNLAFSDDGLSRASLSAQPAAGMLTLSDHATGTNNIELMAVAGDYAAVLPDDAINSDEILDEPGIAGDLSTGSIPLSAGVMTDLRTISIDIPSGGYIHVEGWCWVNFLGASGGQYAHVQIDETSGGTYSEGHCNLAGKSNFSTTEAIVFPMYVNRNYYKADAGTYQFRMEGEVEYDNGTVECGYPNITAVYYPTSYTAVKAVTDNPGDYPDPTTVTAVDPITKTEKTVYEIDLRYYELKAKDARMKALEAELELRHKQMEALRQSAGEEVGQ